MNNKGKKEASQQAAASASNQYDPATLLALYSMSNAYGLGGATGASGMQAAAAAAASAAAANTSGAGSNASNNPYASNQLGLNQWWTMASQLAAQEYLTRIQAAARDPQAYAALAAQGVLPNYEMLTGGSKARLKLPNDTEIIKYTSSATGSKEPGSSTRGRKKTISLDPNLSNADYASLAGNISSSSNDSTPPSIPAGLTIERKSRKNQGSGEDGRSYSPSIDRVEITKIPANGGSPLASSFMPKSSTPKASSSSSNGEASSSGNAVSSSAALSSALQTAAAAAAAIAAAGGTTPTTAGGETPLNLSTKSSPFMSPISAQSHGGASSMGATDTSSLLYTSKSIGGSKIPQEYYACEYPNKVFFSFFVFLLKMSNTLFEHYYLTSIQEKRLTSRPRFANDVLGGIF